MLVIGPAELNYYPLMVSLGNCSGSCNVADEFSIKTCVPSKTKDVYVKVFYMITRTNKAKTLIKPSLCDCKGKFIIQHVIQIKNAMMKHVSVSVRVIVRTKMILVRILRYVLRE